MATALNEMFFKSDAHFQWPFACEYSVISLVKEKQKKKKKKKKKDKQYLIVNSYRFSYFKFQNKIPPIWLADQVTWHVLAWYARKYFISLTSWFYIFHIQNIGYINLQLPSQWLIKFSQSVSCMENESNTGIPKRTYHPFDWSVRSYDIMKENKIKTQTTIISHQIIFREMLTKWPNEIR